MTVWPVGSEDHLLTPIAPILMNVPKNKIHALGHTNLVRMKYADSGVTVWPVGSEDHLLTPIALKLMGVHLGYIIVLLRLLVPISLALFGCSE